MAQRGIPGDHCGKRLSGLASWLPQCSAVEHLALPIFQKSWISRDLRPAACSRFSKNVPRCSILFPWSRAAAREVRFGFVLFGDLASDGWS
jgi:hypothetical protein